MINVLLVPLVVALAVITVFAFSGRDWLATGIAFVGLTASTLQLFDAVLDVAPRHAAQEPSSGPALRIVSVNAFHDNGDPARLTEAVTRARPDVVLVQEADGAAGPTIARLLPGYARVFSCAAPPCSAVILSRWPATRVVDDGPQGVDLPDLLIARIRAPFGDFNVVSAHMPRMYMWGAAPFRSMLADALSTHDELPTLMGGDLNLPTGSFGLFRFERSILLKRAERWIPTYPANLPFPAIAAIDHVYVSSGWAVQECQRLASTGSDHFGLACDVVPGLRVKGFAAP